VAGSEAKKKKTTKPSPAIIMLGTAKDMPQSNPTKVEAIREPTMLPTEGWDLLTPIIKPLIGLNY